MIESAAEVLAVLGEVRCDLLLIDGADQDVARDGARLVATLLRTPKTLAMPVLVARSDDLAQYVVDRARRIMSPHAEPS